MDDLVTLIKCRPGLFLFEGEVHLKTEYGTESPQGSQQWWPEAYCGSTGEYFWGGAKTHEERADLMVRPLDAAAVEHSRDDAERAAAFLEMHKAELLRMHKYHVNAYLKLWSNDENRALEYGRAQGLERAMDVFGIEFQPIHKTDQPSA
jgi:hypothetical protein